MRAKTCSFAVRGATCVRVSVKLGSGNARRSTLPLGVSGNESSATNADGTMCAGNDARTCSASSVVGETT